LSRLTKSGAALMSRAREIATAETPRRPPDYFLSASGTKPAF